MPSVVLGLSAGEHVRDDGRLEEAVHEAMNTVLGGCCGLRVSERHRGAFNRVWRFTGAAGDFGLRVRVDERNYRYEPDILKEVYAVLALNGRPVRNVPAVGDNLSHPVVGDILHWDWSRKVLPHPWVVYRWRVGKRLADRPAPEAYRRAGEQLALLHQHPIDGFRVDVRQAGAGGEFWSGRYRQAVDSELTRARGRLGDPLRQAIGAIDVPCDGAGPPRIVHNDAYCLNFVVSPDGGCGLIDWDNWVTDVAEMDLVKMRHWTVIDGAGSLAADPSLYQAFRDGYERASGKCADQRLLAACERLWLLRVFNFETDQETSGRARGLFPRSDVYARVLDARVKESLNQ